MVVADPEATLLTACANGYGKRTPFGPNSPLAGRRRRRSRRPTTKRADGRGEPRAEAAEQPKATRTKSEPRLVAIATARSGAAARACATSRPPTATGRWSAWSASATTTKLLMMTARGKIQRIVAGEISVDRPQHAGRADHEPRRRRHAGRRRARAARRKWRRRRGSPPGTAKASPAEPSRPSPEASEADTMNDAGDAGEADDTDE